MAGGTIYHIDEEKGEGAERPKVSVIVPVYRTEPFLRRCVNSLRSQTLQEIQIILVDDGSPDGCPALCDQLAREDARILVIHQKNCGAGMARNAGVERSAGEYIGFVDSDDYILPEMMEKLYEAACRYDADMVLAGVRYQGGITFSEEGREEIKNSFSCEELFQENDIKKLMLGIAGAAPEEREDTRYGFSTCKNLYRSAFLQEGGIRFLSEREICSEDALFLLDFMLRRPKCVGIPGAWYCYCRNGDSFSKSCREGRFKQQKRLIEEMEFRLRQVASKEEYRLYLDRQLQACARTTSIQEAVYAKRAGLPVREGKLRLKKICGDPELQAALKRYPYWRLPPMQAAFAFAMRWQLVGLQRLLVALREKR